MKTYQQNRNPIIPRQPACDTQMRKRRSEHTIVFVTDECAARTSCEAHVFRTARDTSLSVLYVLGRVTTHPLNGGSSPMDGENAVA